MVSKKHLTEEDRSTIEQMLKERKTLKSIAERLGISRSTISREIKKHSVVSDKSAPYRIANRCIHRIGCQESIICPVTPCKNDRHREHCSYCKHCNTVCGKYKEEQCHRLTNPPYVCNGCREEQKCVLRKKYYLYKVAQKEYKNLLVQSRTGANITESALSKLDELVSPLVRKGQSIHHIMASNLDSFEICEKTLYRYVHARMIAARNFDMPRIMRMKPLAQKSLVEVTHELIRRIVPKGLLLILFLNLTSGS